MPRPGVARITARPCRFPLTSPQRAPDSAPDAGRAPPQARPGAGARRGDLARRVQAAHARADRPDGRKPDWTYNMLLRHGVRSCLEYAKSFDLKRARALTNPQLAPHLEFVDMGGHGYAKVRLTADRIRTEFVCIPRPLELDVDLDVVFGDGVWGQPGHRDEGVVMTLHGERPR